MPRVLPALLLASILCTAGAGCLFQGQGRAEALADAVHGMVDETRWGQAELAADRVAPAFRARFMEAHARWGEAIEIADVDVTMVRMARDEESATAILSVSWYALETMELSTTNVRQRWEHQDGNYVLARETVISGNARLLDIARPAAANAATPASAPHIEAARAPTDG